MTKYLTDLLIPETEAPYAFHDVGKLGRHFLANLLLYGTFCLAVTWALVALGKF